MSEEKKINKRKIIIRYVILAVTILAIAVSTMLIVFASNGWFKGNASIDSGTEQTPNEDEENKNDDTPTVSDTTWLTPVASVNVITSYEFTQNVSLMNSWHMHKGIDFAGDVGTEVLCAYDGTVESIVLDNSLDGNKVTIKHADGVKTTYSFIDVNESIKVGKDVKRGDVIGTISQSTGSECNLQPHLHFEVIANGKNADPELYLEMSPK
ncbi:MAG: peptidoglycan DD-metalloendopeptidase family protein [Candidatus Coproplasma sp.]